MTILKLSVIRIDGGTQARLSLVQEKVTDYAERMREGDAFPPATVYFDGSNYWLADGFHRYFATKANGKLDIDCEITEGTVEEAQLFALQANGRHGIPMSAEDNRANIIRMLEHPTWGEWSNRQIAKHLNVSPMTVGRVKTAWEKSQVGAEKVASPKKFKDKHGNETTMQTKNIGKKEQPKQTHDEIIQELSETIQALSEENTLLKDKIALGQWDASEIEKIDAQETITELREQIKVLEIDNKTLRESRDTYQNRNAELMRMVKTLQNKLKKLEEK